MAEGTAGEGDLTRLAAIRGLTQTEFAVDTAADMRGWLEKAEMLCDQLEDVLGELSGGSEGAK